MEANNMKIQNINKKLSAMLISLIGIIMISGGIYIYKGTLRFVIYMMQIPDTHFTNKILFAGITIFISSFALILYLIMGGSKLINKGIETYKEAMQ